MLRQKGLDLTRQKPYGPRWPGGAVKDGQQQVTNGADLMMTDYMILRFIIAREWNMENIVKDIYRHLEWRQTNIPMPLLESRTIRLLKRGVLYIHGRAKDLSPILIINFKAIGEAMDDDDIDPDSFC